MKQLTRIACLMMSFALFTGFTTSPEQEAPPAAEAPAAEAPAAEAPAAEAPAAEAPAAEAPAAEAPAAPVTCKKYVECTCALAKASGDKAACKAAKTAAKADGMDCNAAFVTLSATFTEGQELPARCQ